MDLQAQLALKGIKVQSFFPDDNGGLIVTYLYKWVVGSGEVRWDHGFALVGKPYGGMSYRDQICQSIINGVERSREYLKDKTPEVL